MPSWAIPQAKNFMNRAVKLSNSQYQPYKGQQIAPLNSNQNSAISMIRNRAINGDPMLRQSNQLTADNLSGKYLQGNPYLDQVLEKTNRDITTNYTNSIMPQTNANMARQGAFGGSSWQQANDANSNALARAISDNTATMRYNDYSNERANQLNAISTAQALSQQPYDDAKQLMGVGDVQRDYTQTLNKQNYQNFLNKQNWPLQNLDVLANAIRTTMGGGGSSVTQAAMPQINPATALLGGGMAGAGIASGMGYGGTGQGVGAGLGALASYLGR